MKEKLEKIKELIIKSDGKDNKKKIENLVVFIIILIITIIAINTIWKDDKEDTKTISNNNKQLASTDTSVNTFTSTSQEENLKTDLENILSKINGVGKVKVLVTYTESSQIVAMYNENTKETSTEEKDETGGTRTIKESDTQKDVIYQEENGEKNQLLKNNNA